MSLYTALLRPLLFRLDPEAAHRVAIRAGAWLGGAAPLMEALLGRPDPLLATRAAGLDFPSPLGLAAGFDKSGEAVRLLAALGFGHLEVGSVSARPSAGNPRPRLFRLPRDQATVVHYGLPNDGVEVVAARLAAARRLSAPLGINLVNTNRGIDAAPATDEQIIEDYLTSARRLQGVGDYLTLNLSCPNTRDGREFFAERHTLESLLQGLANLGVDKPVFLKLCASWGTGCKEALLALAEPHPFVKGFILNLPPGKPPELRFSTPLETVERYPGAVSGPPAEALLLDNLTDLIRRMDRTRYVVMASGGIRTAQQVYARLKAGASLVQVLTTLVYDGPGVVSRINHDLAALLRRDGAGGIAEVIGVEAP